MSPAKKMLRTVVNLLTPTKSRVIPTTAPLPPKPYLDLKRKLIGYEILAKTTPAFIYKLYSKSQGKFLNTTQGCKSLASESQEPYPRMKVTIPRTEMATCGMAPGSQVLNCDVRFHQVAAVLKWGLVYGDQAMMEKLIELSKQGNGTGITEASHLCGEPRCISIEHLWLEVEAVNKSRDRCKGTIESTCNGCKQVKRVVLCQHEPKCVKVLKI